MTDAFGGTALVGNVCSTMKNLSTTALKLGGGYVMMATCMPLSEQSMKTCFGNPGVGKLM